MNLSLFLALIALAIFGGIYFLVEHYWSGYDKKDEWWKKLIYCIYYGFLGVLVLIFWYLVYDSIVNWEEDRKRGEVKRERIEESMSGMDCDGGYTYDGELVVGCREY